MVNILVTGGLGYIGSHTCSKLIEKGHNIYILDSLYNSSYKVFESLQNIRELINPSKFGSLLFFHGDIRDDKFIKSVFNLSNNKNQSIEFVFHFAGLKSVYESTINPSKYWDVNFEGTKTLINSMELYGCKNFIFSSSATVYGNAGIGIINENNVIKPTNIYGQTKAKVEKYLFSKYQETKDWKIINLRYFNPIGAHKSGLIGDRTILNFNNLFPLLCKAANKEIDFIEIYGNDWNTRDGTCIRDFIHIMDIANGHISALDYLMNNKTNFLSLNLGSAKGTTVLELVKIFEKTINKKINYVFSKRRNGDVASYIASNDMAKRILNWHPTLKLDEMCLDGWKWYLKSKD